MGVAGMALLALLACAAPVSLSPPASATPLSDEFRADALDKRALWRKQLVWSYRIRFEFVEDATLPAPFAPSTATNSPRSTFSETLFSTGRMP